MKRLSIGAFVVLVLTSTVLGQTPGITGGAVDQPTALANRQAMTNATNIVLPASTTVRLDASYAFTSNQTLNGQGSTLLNYYTTNDRTVFTLAGSIGYGDPLTVTGANEVTFTNHADAANYKAGQPCYLFYLNGSQGGPGQLRTLHGIASSDANTGKMKLLGPALDSRLTAAKWYTQASVVNEVKQGQTTFMISDANVFKPGQWVHLDSGPSEFNEADGEWHRVTNVFPSSSNRSITVTIDSPASKAYSGAVLAICNPITDVNIKNVTFGKPPAGSPFETFFAKFCNSWRFDSITASGDFWFTASAFCVFTNCTFQDGVFLNSCHDIQFINCTFKTVGIEELCHDIDFSGCTFTGSAGMNEPSSFRCHFHGCSFNGALTGLGLQGNDHLVDGCSMDNAAAALYIKGDRNVVRNLTSAGIVWAQWGADTQLTNVRAIAVTLGGVTNKASRGIVLESPNTVLSTGSWTLVP